MRICIIGFGYLGAYIGNECMARGCKVVAINRSECSVPPSSLFELVRCDITSDPLPIVAGPLTAVIYCIAPDYLDEASFQMTYETNLLKALAWHRDFYCDIPFVLTSCTGIYHHGQPVIATERDPLSLDTPICHILGNGESLTKEWASQYYILRLGGLYGPNHLNLFSRLAGLEGGNAEEESYLDEVLNVIHVDDAARLCMHLLQTHQSSGIYNGVDCDPSPRRDVLRWLKIYRPDLLVDKKQPLYKEIEGGCWVCTNKKVLATGFTYKYPSFRAGILALPRPLAHTPALDSRRTIN